MFVTKEKNSKLNISNIHNIEKIKMQTEIDAPLLYRSFPLVQFIAYLYPS